MSGKSPVVTLTPAPTLDRTYFVHDLIEGGVNRADDVAEELAGKGINVTRALNLVGIAAPGVVPIGNSDPSVLKRTGHADWLVPLWVDGTLRVSTTMVVKDGPTTKVNEAPRALSGQDWQSVIELTVRTVRDNDAKWLVIAGALPVDKSTGKYVDLTPIFEEMKKLGVRVALDTSGEPLQKWASAGAASVMKPNAEELASAVGRSLSTNGDVIDAARELISNGVECVLASLGSDGMIAVTAKNSWHAKTPPIKVINTVGAGDSTLAGFLSAVAATTNGPTEENYFVGFDVPAGLKMAVQWGAVKVQQPTSGLQNLDHMPEATVVAEPDRATALKEPAHV
ncbi:MAG: 1-phosphofructokinase family hexose kinase [Rhodoluna sp.]